MFRTTLGAPLRRMRGAIAESLRGEFTPHETALSFAVGTFVTMLPTFGAGFLVFGVLLVIARRLDRVALVASVVVFNPAVKWGVYAASVAIGVLLLGPVEGDVVSLSAGPDLLVRLLVGNLLLAVVATVLGYVVVYRLAVAYASSPVGEIIDEAVEDVADELAVE